VSARSLGDGRVRRYRNVGITFWFNASYTLVFGLIAAGFVYGGVMVASHRSWIVIGGLLGLAAAWRFARALRSGIEVDRNGVTARSTIGRIQRARWDEVIRFEPVLRRDFFAIALVCSDGRRLFSSGCLFRRWSKNSGSEKMDRMVRALEAERATGGTQPG
jgi:cytochrome c biogenesis protein CcdA